MIAFIDATCKHCGKRFGWQGELTDPPPACPSCGKDLGADKDMEKIRDMLGPQPTTAEGFFKARRYAGLSFSNAAQLLKVTKPQLEDIEEGRSQPSPEVVQRMAILYRVAFTNEQSNSEAGPGTPNRA